MEHAVIEMASQWGFLLDRKGTPVSTTNLLIAASAYQKACLLHIDSDFKIISATVDLDEEKID